MLWGHTPNKMEGSCIISILTIITHSKIGVDNNSILKELFEDDEEYVVYNTLAKRTKREEKDLEEEKTFTLIILLKTCFFSLILML